MTSDLAAYNVNEVANTDIQDALATYVKEKFTAAKEHKDRIGVSSRLLRNLRAKNNQYQPDELELLEDNDLYIGICSLKQRAAESWLIDIIVNNIEHPWMLKPTPEPELREEQKEQIIDILIKELPMINSMAALRERAKVMKSIAQMEASEQAARSTKRMETRIQDQFSEGGWNNTFKDFVADLTTFPSGFMRGPFIVSEPQGQWRNNKFEVKQKSLVKTRPISPFNAFPAPNSSTTQNGDYFIEAVAYSYSDIYDLKDVKGFLSSNIRAALDEYDTGYELDNPTAKEAKLLQGKDEGTEAAKNSDLEILILNGKVPGKLLAEHGVLIDDLQKHYECEVWVLGDYTLKAILNPNPLGKRPVHGTSYVKVNGSIWGQSPICLVYDTMRTCNAAVRALARNMGYSSGPLGEVVADRLAEGEDPTDLAPYHIFQVSADLTGTGAKAFNFHKVESVAPDLMSVIDRFMKLADDLSGVPAYVLGNAQVAGAGRTLGGLSMLMGNAAKGIKHVQLNIDSDVISSIVEAFYIYNMLTSDDMGIKGDAKVIARGATGLLQRELAQTRTVEILQLLTPYAQAGLLDKEAIQYILREILKTTGMDVDRVIPDPDANQELADIANILGVNASALERGTGTPVSLPPQSQPGPGAQPPYPVPVNLAQGA